MTEFQASIYNLSDKVIKDILDNKERLRLNINQASHLKAGTRELLQSKKKKKENHDLRLGK